MIKKILTVSSLLLLLFFYSNSHASNCTDINEYPNWPQTNWAGVPNHALAGDQMHYDGVLYQAKWWTNSLPGSSNAWQKLGVCKQTPPLDGAFSRYGKLSVCGKTLCDKNNTPVQLRGMSSHGLQWFGLNKCLTQDSLATLANNWRADILRLSLYVQEGGYVTNPASFTQQVNQLVALASDLDMYVLVDWHQLTPGDPNDNLQYAKQFFHDIVAANKHRDNVIYDIANEPNGVNWQRIYDYAVEIIPTIRALNPDAVILVGTHGWSTFGASDGGSYLDVLNNPLPFNNVMYTFHFYAASHLDFHRDMLDKASNVLPVFVTEWGTQDYRGEGPNNFASAQAYLDLMANKKISWTNWNFSDDWRSGAVFKVGACQAGTFDDSQLKEAGIWVKQKIATGR
ncbi:cellulase family glycosylhydrolase [Pseudoalteromonas sp. JBTF-M23]|uniref:Cellulase family glycosylhydrolase n=1 Tax=Pseudoalteromonas caenipelagi TaxID=2726988 RepID=A0A849VCJ8_9GAMM|nr:cellulase family glycosylhydrolase [Pseudoalteromonas caenipelagi]NOU50520.1 cellulase family glycosylhydrolase [Pseudoalteromonas caenipelagi]